MSVIYPAIRSAVYPAVRGALDISEKKQTSEQTPEQIIQSLFDQGQQGFWFPFMDFASLTQDSAGTLPYTALEQPVGRVLDRSGRGNNASQVTSTARGVVSARVNLLQKTEDIGASPWVALAGVTVQAGARISPTGDATMSLLTHGVTGTTQALKQVFDCPASTDIKMRVALAKNSTLPMLVKVFDGSISVQLSTVVVSFALDVPSILSRSGVIGEPTLTQGPNDTWYLDFFMNSGAYSSLGFLIYPSAGNQAGGSVYVWGASASPASQSALPYQRVNTPTDYDAVGFPKYLRLDGVDDRLQATLPDITGTWIVGYKEGTLVYKVAIPAGAFPIGTNSNGAFNSQSKNFVGMVLRAGDLTEVEVSAVESYLVANGAGAAGVDAFAGKDSFSSAWYNCTSLTSFPLINTAAGTNFIFAWTNCSSLTSFPLINTAAGTNFNSAWQGCASLTSFPLINTAAGTNFASAWNGCTSLTSFPLINTAAGTFFSYAWNGCTSLTSFPLINTAAGTNFQSAWFDCSSLTSFPLINTATGTNFNFAWTNCSSLTSFPLINTAAGTNFQSAWNGCTSLTSFPLINTAAGTNFNGAWYGCASLTSFPSNMFDSCQATNFIAAFLDCALSQASVDGILASLVTAGKSNGTLHMHGGTSSTPSAAGLASKATLVSRGWTVTHN